MGWHVGRPGVDDFSGTTMLIGHSVSDADGRILTMDRALCDLLQRPERVLVGMNYADFTHSGDVVRNRSAVDALTIGQGPLRVRKRYVRGDGTLVWCEVYVSRLQSGAVGRLVGTIHRIGQGEQAEGPERLWHAAREIAKMMQLRRAELGDDLFADHAWGILLQTYLAEAEGRLIRAEELADATTMTAGMAERWLNALEAKGYIDRDCRESGIVQLSHAGVARVERLLSVSAVA